MKQLFLTFGFLAAALPALAATKVATLHPILADLARQVGGANVEVVEILKPGADIHHFEPAPKDLAEMRGTKLLLASGKGLESFLDKLRDSLGADVKLVEVGAKIPSIPFEEHHHEHAEKEKDHDHEEHDHHHHGSEDPHWWHSAENMKRAARVVADELSAVDPANASAYAAGAKVASKRFGELKSWAQKEIAKIGKKDRLLVTAHGAFGYFCKEYGFEPISLLGIGRSDDASSKHVAETIEEIREHGIKAVFPEDQANPKVLAEIARSTGVKIGEPLIADGTAKVAHTFETMLAHNVRSIVAALAPAAAK
ncbi:metal ABC transporter substrate-binding protein [Prosthecobacter vanneervenii]|uniref:Zinc/manganese transport system substrate-binding protein n=1 Tax=Prosthecobacter vanneervenii TaxID=48466 RepID=A0A7W7Y9H8_9BACT|nr:metal ABC transporter substrate-binding protein [Prosthecobacter vanneervenii]MBB5032122.1 zinc/manganese transport system substrate-binding protein [Prosthecobacter vanneervenii]